MYLLAECFGNLSPILQGKIYLFIEAVSQLYRSIATVQPWLYYFLESYQGAEKTVAVFLSAFYMISKGSDLMFNLAFLKAGAIKLLQSVVSRSFKETYSIPTRLFSGSWLHSYKRPDASSWWPMSDLPRSLPYSSYPGMSAYILRKLRFNVVWSRADLPVMSGKNRGWSLLEGWNNVLFYSAILTMWRFSTPQSLLFWGEPRLCYSFTI